MPASENLSRSVPNRRPSVTAEVGQGLTVTISFCPTTNTPVEIFLTGRGKASDSPMTEALYNLGVVASKIMRHEVHDD